MHRTQLLIEDWQYQALRARAEREGRSLSDLMRELLATALARGPQTPQPSCSRLADIEGIGEDTGAYGDDHDRHLYGDADRD